MTVRFRSRLSVRAFVKPQACAGGLITRNNVASLKSGSRQLRRTRPEATGTSPRSKQFHQPEDGAKENPYVGHEV